MLQIIRHKKIFLITAGAYLAIALACIIVFGFRQGIDFQGGTLWQFRTGSATSTPSEVENIFRDDLKIEDAVLNYESGRGVFFARFSAVSEEVHQENVSAMKKKIPGFEELSFQSIGPSVGSELRKNALIAIVLVLVGISLYIAFAFRKTSRPVSSWKYGIITLVTLFHDVLIPAGLLAVLGHYKGVEIDSNFVVALLVIMGFSVHDTIVVFDRIRENLSLDRGRTDFGTIINQSINQTMSRSINTSLTLVLVLVALYAVGPQSLSYFILTLLVGVVMGTYSSVFVASPALLLLTPKQAEKRKK